MACKLVDKHVKLKNIASALFNYQKRQDPSLLLNDDNLKEYEALVAIAESNIIKVIGFDFTVEAPFAAFYDLTEQHFKSSREVWHLGKVIQLDLYRSGASLFYPPVALSVSALLMTNYLLTGEVTRASAARCESPLKAW